MTTRANSVGRSLLTSLVAAATIWSALLTWRPLTESPADYVIPLLVCGAVVAVLGGVARWRGLRPLGVLGLQLVIAVPLLLSWTTGSPLPAPAGLTEFAHLLARGSESANVYAAPVPATVPSVAPLFLTVGLASILLVDLLAVSARKVASTGLVLLVLHLVPVNLDVAVPWWIFALVTTGFLLLLFLDQDDLVVRWGEDIEDLQTSSATPASGGWSGVAAAKIGALAGVGALVLTSVLSTLLPASPTRLWSGSNAGDSGQVTLASPLVDMRRDLVRGLDVPLLRVEGARKPTYVRTAVLADFDGSEWSTGDRKATRVQAASGIPLSLTGVDVRLKRTETDYVFAATTAFRSSWLPTMSASSSVRAEGDWRYDRDTTDFAAFDKTLTTSGLSWDVVGVDLDYSAVALDRAPSAASQVDSSFTELPRALPKSIESTAKDVAGDSPTRFRQARALQDWFRSEFTYSLAQADAVGSDELVAFLDESGRVGYCEQFSAAMAVMARTLGIPSRVAVGFLSPERVGPEQWEFSSHDLHAWPELYFAGSGWVKFEPTPASRASGVPSYTEDAVEPVAEPSSTPSPTATPSAPTPTADPSGPSKAIENTKGTEAEPRIEWWRLISAFAGVALMTLVMLTPQWIRRRRRAHRLASGLVEELWAELRDSSIDLGHDWPTGRSPRAVGAQVSQWSSPDEEGSVIDLESGEGGLIALVEAVERERYAHPHQRRHDDANTLVLAVNDSVAGLQANASRSARWRSRWVPRSLASRRRN